jgi:predicted GNAT family acetyltransferase
MTAALMLQDTKIALDAFADAEPCIVRELNQSEEMEVLEFLGARPVHTVFMATLIRDNGLVSSRNRGSFYACRSRHGELEGVALLGHATLVEARTENSLATLAGLARNCQSARLIRGERKMINRFWEYAKNGEKPRLVCRELLFALNEDSPTDERVNDLRPATIGDLDKIVTVNAAMAFDQCGIRPLEMDPAGFRNRLARRIEQGRVWVWIRDNRLIFKADVIGETAEVTYLEAVQVHPDERRKGYGLRCVKQLSSNLLSRSKSICLTVNHRNKNAVTFYSKAGYKFHSHYETIYLH